MTQTEIIKAEIERRKVLAQTLEIQPQVVLCNTLLSFIESLEKGTFGQLGKDGPIVEFVGELEKEQASTDETELNALAYLTQLGYTCVPDGAPKIKGWVARDEDGEIFLMQKNRRKRWTVDENLYRFYILPEEVFPELKLEDDPIEVELTINKV